MTEIVCTQCQCDNVRQMKRQGPIERWIYPLMSMYPFLCGRCGNRFGFVEPEDGAEEVPSNHVATEPAN